MKTKEIEKLAKQENFMLMTEVEAFIKAYTKCQEDIKQKLSNMVMTDADIFEMCKIEVPELTTQREMAMFNYLKGAKLQRDYFKKIIDELS